MDRRQGRPVWLPNGSESQVLQRLEPKAYDESWLQALIHDEPSVLPIWEIEPACWPAFPVCRELRLRSGFADNLFINPDGNLTLVECKLWRNPEARRSVIAQILEYAKDLSDLGFAELEQCVAASMSPTGKSLYEIAQSTLEESEFVDAVSRNLRRGRVLLIVAGDGITESAESLADHLQQHAGIHFTLALVQLAVFEVPGAGRVVVPSTLARTINVIRGIVEVREGVAKVGPAPLPATQSRTLTEEEFFEQLDRDQPGTSDRIRALVAAEPDLGLHYQVKKTLIIRLPLGELGSVNVLVIYPNGHVDTSLVWWRREAIDPELILRLQEDTAATTRDAYVTRAAKMPGVSMPKPDAFTIWNILDHQTDWFSAVRRFRDAVLEEQSAES